MNEKSKKNLENRGIDEIYNKINGNGKFDWLIAFPVGIGYCMSLTYLVPFMTKLPTPLWIGINSDGEEYTWNWSTQEICSSDYRPFYIFDQTSSTTFTNWITKLNLLCISDFNLGLFGSFYIAGFVFGALTLLRLGDIFGRKKVLFIANIINFCLFLLLFVSTNVKVIYFLLFSSGATRMLAGSLSYILMLEVIPESKRSKFSAFVMAWEGLAGSLIIGSIYMFQNCFVTMLMMTVLAIIQIFFVLYWPESPKFLYSVNKRKELEKSLRTIANMNGYNVSNNEFEFDEIEIDSSKKDSVNLFQSFKDETYRKNIVIMWLICCVAYMSYYMIGYYINKFNGNLFINAFALITADVTSNLSSNILNKYLGLKYTFGIIFLLITSATILYTSFSHIFEITYAWVFIMRFGATLSCTLSMYSCSVLFDTKIQARSFAFWNFIGRSMTILAPLVVTLTPNPMIIITTLAISASIISQGLIVPKKPNISK